MRARSMWRLDPLKYRWLIFLVLSMGYLLVYFHRVSCAVVATDLTEAFDASGAVLGVLASAYFYPYTIMQLPVGMLADSLGARKTVTVFLLIACVGTVLFGFSRSISAALFGRILVGLGAAVIFVPAVRVLAEWFRKEEFALMLGIITAIGGIGWLAAATPLALLSDWLGWRAAFVGIGAATLILALCVWTLVRDRPEDMGFSPLLEASLPDDLAGHNLPHGLKRVLTEKYFWPLAIRGFFNYGTVIGLGGLWGGPYLIDVYGLSKTQAANVLTMIPLGMIMGGPLVGWLSDRVFKARKPVMVWGTLVYVLAWVPLAFWTAGIHPFILYLLTFVVGLTGCSLVAVNFTAVKELFPKEMAGTSTGMANVFPFAGGAVFPPIMGYIMDTAARTGGGGYSAAAYKATFTFCLISSAASFLSVCLMKETLGKGAARS